MIKELWDILDLQNFLKLARVGNKELPDVLTIDLSRQLTYKGVLLYWLELVAKSNCVRSGFLLRCN